MDFAESIKNMFKVAQEGRLVASLPMCMATPLDGTKVRFWTKQVMRDEKAQTTVGNSLVGEYREGYFMIDTDSWSENEIFSWAKLEEK